jgi:RNA polymerase sigma factor (sigma-70 family)
VRQDEWLASQFEEHRGRLRTIAYRVLGSHAEAEDAVQEAWLRLSRTDAGEIENLGGWLTTVVGRICLNTLRTRANRPEEPLGGHVPDPVVTLDADPESQALLADSVGWAMMVVLESLTPIERLAFVLHDLFAVPFEEIAPLVERTPAATRQIASRARRRIEHHSPAPEPDPARQRAVVDAFFAASREGNLDALVAVLDPDVILRSDGGTTRPRLNFTLYGPAAIAGQALASGTLSPFVRPALINGQAGVVVAAKGRAIFVMAFTVANGLIVGIDVLADPDRLERLDLDLLDFD